MDLILLLACFGVVILMMFFPVPSKVRITGAVFAAFLFLAGSWATVQEDSRFIREGVQTTGNLIATTCAGKRGRRDKIDYRFMVQQKVISGSGRLGSGNQPCERLQINDQIFITYLHSDPSVNRPARNVKSNAPTILFIALVIFVAAFALNIAAANHKAKKNIKRTPRQG